jgi:hypothetical protein
MIEHRKVTKEEFDIFITTYPNKLVRDVAWMYEPPLLSFNDFKIAGKWPESVVAYVVLAEDSYPNEDGSKRPNEYYIVRR